MSGPRVVDPQVKKAMKEVPANIQDGTFAKRLIADQDNSGLEFKALHAEGENHPTEKTDQKLRKALGWTSVDTDYTNGSTTR